MFIDGPGGDIDGDVVDLPKCVGEDRTATAEIRRPESCLP